MNDTLPLLWQTSKCLFNITNINSFTEKLFKNKIKNNLPFSTFSECIRNTIKTNSVHIFGSSLPHLLIKFINQNYLDFFSKNVLNFYLQLLLK